MGSPAGWHAQEDGRERYWDGTQWTDHYRGGTQPAVVPPKRGNKKHIIGYGATALVALGIGSAMGASGGGSPNAAPVAAVTTTVTAPAPDPVTSTVTKGPTVTHTVRVTPQPVAAIEEGTWEVGVDVKPGKYKTVTAVTDGCYWSITRTGTDDIVDNGLPTGGRPVVVIKKGQTFETKDCGSWAKVG